MTNRERDGWFLETVFGYIPYDGGCDAGGRRLAWINPSNRDEYYLLRTGSWYPSPDDQNYLVPHYTTCDEDAMQLLEVFRRCAVPTAISHDEQLGVYTVEVGNSVGRDGTQAGAITKSLIHYYESRQAVH